MRKSIQKYFVLMMAIFLLIGMVPTSVSAASTPGVSYQTHIENIGWEADAGIGIRSNGEASGTFARSLRLEGIKINLTNTTGYDLGVSYQTHIENIGWEDDAGIGWQSNGDMSGTYGRSLRLEAIQIKLTGADADKFDVYYQVHAQNIGWMGWAKNGESAGTAGYSYRLEAIKIQIVPKGADAPGKTNNAFVSPANPYNSAEYGELFSGTWTAGVDIQPGRYAISPDGGSGNFIVYSKDGHLVANDILGSDDFGVPLIETTIPDGASIRISGLENVKFTPVSRTLRTSLPSGSFEVGMDIAPGTYLASSTSYSGNFVIYSAAGRLKTNEILGTSEYSVSKVKVDLETGDTINISGLKTVEFN